MDHIIIVLRQKLWEYNSMGGSYKHLPDMVQEVATWYGLPRDQIEPTHPMEKLQWEDAMKTYYWDKYQHTTENEARALDKLPLREPLARGAAASPNQYLGAASTELMDEDKWQHLCKIVGAPYEPS